jgi:hypothetical protein
VSVIVESYDGDPIVFIANGTLCEDGIPFSLENAQNFSIGDVVYFEDFFKLANEPQEYLAWFVRFRTAEGKRYSAVQTYFVTMDDWQALTEYFRRRSRDGGL